MWGKGRVLGVWGGVQILQQCIMQLQSNPMPNGTDWLHWETNKLSYNLAGCSILGRVCVCVWGGGIKAHQLSSNVFKEWFQSVGQPLVFANERKKERKMLSRSSGQVMKFLCFSPSSSWVQCFSSSPTNNTIKFQLEKREVQLNSHWLLRMKERKKNVGSVVWASDEISLFQSFFFLEFSAFHHPQQTKPLSFD